METIETKAAAAESKPRRRSRTVRQVVLRELGEVGRYRVRLVKSSDKPDAASFLDVREYVRGANYEGFTRKGVRLGGPEAKALRSMLGTLEAEGALA